MMLIDTSVWIEFFNRPQGKTSRHLEELLAKSTPVAINAIIEMEILQGIREDADHEETKAYLEPFQYFPHFSKKYFDLGAEIFRSCRKRGITVRKSLDCLIAANCLIDGIAIAHHDRDFRQISRIYKDLSVQEL